jgi:hypothetical protein
MPAFEQLHDTEEIWKIILARYVISLTSPRMSVMKSSEGRLIKTRAEAAGECGFKGVRFRRERTHLLFLAWN